MDTTEKIALNNAYQKELNKENAKYYEDLLTYIRSNALFKSEAQTEEVLLDIVQDILDAQREGVNAEAYFGTNPQETADEILQTIPNSWRAFNKLMFMGILSFILFAILPTILMPNLPLDLGKILIASLYAFLISVIFVWLTGKTIYTTMGRRFRLLVYGLFGVMFLSCILLYVYIRTPFIIYLKGAMGIVILLLIGVILVILFSLLNKQERRSWLLWIPIFTTTWLAGVLVRIPTIEAISDDKKMILYAIMFGVLVIQYVVVFRCLRTTK